MSSEECLEPNQLVELMGGRVSEAEKARIEAHVNQCQDCMQLMIDVGRAAGPVSPIDDTVPADGSPYSVGVPSAPHGDELGPGDVVDHFRVERLLGRGGMGEVYRAHDIKLGRTVALKLIHPMLLMKSSDAKQRFENEARATAKLNHPNIVTIHAVGEHAGRPYVALEYLEGRNLREQIALTPPNLERALGMMLSIAEAVEAAHERGVVHRDLKPENVIVDHDGRVRVVDFGLAKIGTVTDEGVPASVHGPGVTTIGGTPLYMAPEQWRLERAGAPADVWALGVMLFELCAREHPFHDYTASDLEALKSNVTSREPPYLGQKSAVPPFLSQLVLRCLDKQPSQRPRASEVVAQLRFVLHELGRAAEPRAELARAAPSSRLKHQRASRRASIVALAAVSIAALAMIWAWRMTRSTEAKSSASASAPVVSATVATTSSAEPLSTQSSAPAPSSTKPVTPPPIAGAPTAKPTATASVKPSSDDPCSDTPDCRGSGRCHMQAGACVVTSDADCKGSTNCQTFGNCAMEAGRCVPTTAAHCRNASRCASWGMCSWVAYRCSAVEAADCRASSECKAKGLCTPSGGWCTAKSDADCQTSALCKSQGRCRLDVAMNQCMP